MDIEWLVVLFGLFGFISQQMWFQNVDNHVVSVLAGVASLKQDVAKVQSDLGEMIDGDDERDERIQRLHEKVDEWYEGDGDDETESHLTAPSVPDEMDRVSLEEHQEERPSMIPKSDASIDASIDASEERTDDESESIGIVLRNRRVQKENC